MNDALLGKKFLFAGIAMLFVSIITGFLRYDAASYLELVKWICGSFLGAQALTDIVGKKDAPPNTTSTVTASTTTVEPKKEQL